VNRHRSRPPAIASWLLRRFAPGPDTDALAGDLFEHYQRGRSARWYWREVVVAIVAGTWFEIRQHSLRMFGAVAAAWLVTAVLFNVMLPHEYLLVVRILGHQARPEQMPLVGFVMGAPFGVSFGWIVARCARPCRVSALWIATAVSLLDGSWALWKNAQIWPQDLHFSVWPWLATMPLNVMLILLGGGVLPGVSKRGRVA
jgi:hypothetical protein